MGLNVREIIIQFTLALVYVSIPTLSLHFDRMHKPRTFILNSHLGSLIATLHSIKPTLFRSSSKARYNRNVHCF